MRKRGVPSSTVVSAVHGGGRPTGRRLRPRAPEWGRGKSRLPMRPPIRKPTAMRRGRSRPPVDPTAARRRTRAAHPAPGGGGPGGPGRGGTKPSAPIGRATTSPTASGRSLRSRAHAARASPTRSRNTSTPAASSPATGGAGPRRMSRPRPAGRPGRSLIPSSTILQPGRHGRNAGRRHRPTRSPRAGPRPLAPAPVRPRGRSRRRRPT